MFLEIWEERNHVSEISGKPLYPLGHFQWHWQFAHVLSKGAYPAFKFRKENIMLMLPEEHERQESYEIFNELKAELKKLYFEERKTN